MAWEKTVNKQAVVTNENLTANFQFIKVGEDGYGADIKELFMTLIIRLDNGSQEAARVRVDDVLTAQERSDLNQNLLKLRDAALTQKGYTNT